MQRGVPQDPGNILRRNIRDTEQFLHLSRAAVRNGIRSIPAVERKRQLLVRNDGAVSQRISHRLRHFPRRLPRHRRNNAGLCGYPILLRLSEDGPERPQFHNQDHRRGFHHIPRERPPLFNGNKRYPVGIRGARRKPEIHALDTPDTDDSNACILPVHGIPAKR